MADTARTRAALQALLANNTSGDISGQDVRDFLLSVFAVTTIGDLPGIDTTGIIGRLPATTDGFVLTLDSGETYGFKWALASGHHDEDHVHDASVVTYTPAVDTDWDADADPGDTDEALDQLAERIDDTEALEHAEAHTLASHPTKAHSELSDAPTSAHHVTSRPYTYSITFGWDPQSPQVFAP